MTFPHAAVWMDHQQAHVLLFGHEDSQHVEIPANPAQPHLHHKSGSIGPGRAPENRHYFDAVANAIKDIPEILVTGPASAKDEFLAYAGTHHPAQRKAIIGLEAADHRTPAQVLAHARRWFDSADRLRPGAGIRLP